MLDTALKSLRRVLRLQRIPRGRRSHECQLMLPDMRTCYPYLNRLKHANAMQGLDREPQFLLQTVCP